jgi:DNA-binding NarL/FixJ family response regulator
MIKVAIFEDNKSRRDSLAAFLDLSAHFKHVGSFINCANVLNDIASCKPDIVFMDIEMPVVDGLQGIKLIKQHFSHIKIIVQTAYDEDNKVFAALQLGAEGYILKSAGIAQLAQSIDEVYQGGAMMSPSIAFKVMRFFNLNNDTTEKREHGLSPKELEVLKMLSDGHSYKMIANAQNISYHTVNNHVKAIYKKLHVHSIGEAISFGHKQGLF